MEHWKGQVQTRWQHHHTLEVEAREQQRSADEARLILALRDEELVPLIAASCLMPHAFWVVSGWCLGGVWVVFV